MSPNSCTSPPRTALLNNVSDWGIDTRKWAVADAQQRITPLPPTFSVIDSRASFV
jgi:hypothetical protein